METEYKEWKDKQLGNLVVGWHLTIEEQAVISNILDQAFLLGRIAQCQKQTAEMPDMVKELTNG